jgi:acyl phosphate:glycerol-3-phosphate acyltransferase
MKALVWAGVGFACGALPFSVWLSRLFAGADARRFGDGNPGAAHAWRAGGWRVGLAVRLLDYLKGALPVAGAHCAAGLSGWTLSLAAVGPIAGHAFSPLLGFRGGKGLAATFGVWSGLMLELAPLALGVSMVVSCSLIRVDAWPVQLSLAGQLAFLLLRQPDPALLAVWCGNTAIVAWRHRRQLRQQPHLRRWVVGGPRA